MGAARRVVVTGLGLVTPLGVGVSHNWQALTEGTVAISKLSDACYEQMPCRVAACVPRGKKEHELDVSAYFSSGDLRMMSPATMFAVVAADEALKSCSFYPTDESEKERTGVALGMGMVDLQDIINSSRALDQKYSRLSPYFVPRILLNMAAGHISMKYGFQGPNHCVSTACATGAHAIGDSFRIIKHGAADVMICGGTEACINPLGIAGFCRLRALSTRFNDRPELASRPFDSQRDGFVMGEGAGVLVLEEFNHAKSRNARIYGEVLGYGMTGDAYHITAPREDGKGALNAMSYALKEANLSIEDVGHVNAHATSTPLGDTIEIDAMRKLFGSYMPNVQVTSTKGAVGHLLGAAGSVEAVFTVLACHTGYIPLTANLTDPIDVPDVNFVVDESKPWLQPHSQRIALTNSFGFGGTNASLCIASCD